GNNLNQTARKVNSGQWSSGDRVQVVAALMAIGDELRRLRLAVREQGARDDSYVSCQGKRWWQWSG
ncbi:MobC family plasmid mobilization relaxosome protein, partial [Salmonella enterica subsp. enterica serovar Infantis]|nr:MobC family plasmid mobilization relaxosome protein [Salmonella enterica subsp. enterica serovar Infantis]